jgi:lysophospholipase L1-like esterase
MVPRMPEAPRWAWIAIAFCAVAVALFLPQVLNPTASTTDAPPSTADPSSADAPAPSSSSASPAAAVRVLVVGDAWTAGTESGGRGSANWTAVLQRRLADSGHPATFTPAASVGAGYLQPDEQGRTFADLAGSADAAPPDTVIFFGSESDIASTEDVRAAAGRTFEGARSDWPEAQLLAIGPAWTGDAPPATLLAAADGVRQAAADQDVPFVDPLAERWFGDDGAEAGSHPTDDGHRVIAQEVEGALERARTGQPGD